MLRISAPGAICAKVDGRIRVVDKEPVQFVAVPVYLHVFDGLEEVLQALHAGRLWHYGWEDDGHPAMDLVEHRVLYKAQNVTVSMGPKPDAPSVTLSRCSLSGIRILLLKNRGAEIRARIEGPASAEDLCELFNLALRVRIRLDIAEVEGAQALEVE